MAFVEVAHLNDLADGELVAAVVHGRPVCLARCGDEVFAFANNCSHRDFPLSSGEFDPEECSVTCDWHGARFDIRTGAVLALPATKPIATYPCRVEDGRIEVDLG